jgi:putative acetyltransferase
MMMTTMPHSPSSPDSFAHSLTFRSATDEDVLAVQGLVCSVLLEFGISPDLEYRDQDLTEIETAYPAPQALFLLAEDASGELFGTVSLKPYHPGVAELGRLYVAPEYRRRGLGLELMNRAMDHAVAQGYRELWLETYSSMTAAMALYEHLGFTSIPPYAGKYLEFSDRGYKKVLPSTPKPTLHRPIESSST